MSTQTLASSVPVARQVDLAGRPGIPFARLLHVEARKLVDTRAGRGLLIAIGVLTVAAVTLQVWFGDGDSLTFQSLRTSALLPQLFLIPVFGILTATSEVAQRTGMVTYALEPRRARVVAAKALVACAFALVLLVIGFGVAALAHLVAISAKGAPADWTMPAHVIGGVVLGQLLMVLQGVAFGLLFRSTALAIVVYFVLPTAFTVVTALVAAVAELRPWIDLTTAMQPLEGGEMTGDAWAHLATALGLWIALPLAVGTWMLTRREVR